MRSLIAVATIGAGAVLFAATAPAQAMTAGAAAGFAKVAAQTDPGVHEVRRKWRKYRKHRWHRHRHRHYGYRRWHRPYYYGSPYYYPYYGYYGYPRYWRRPGIGLYFRF